MMRLVFYIVLLLLFLPVIVSAQKDTRGEVLYRGYCVSCHGDEGRGDGITSPALLPPPPDFTSKEFKASVDKDEIWASILYGNEGTQMEGFADKVSSEDVEPIIEFILLAE